MKVQSEKASLMLILLILMLSFPQLPIKSTDRGCSHFLLQPFQKPCDLKENSLQLLLFSVRPASASFTSSIIETICLFGPCSELITSIHPDLQLNCFVFHQHHYQCLDCIRGVISIRLMLWVSQ